MLDPVYLNHVSNKNCARKMLPWNLFLLMKNNFLKDFYLSIYSFTHSFIGEGREKNNDVRDKH